MHHGLGDPGADQRERAARRAFGVEQQPGLSRPGRVVDQRDALVELLLAGCHERPVLVDRLAVEPVQRQALQDIADGQRLQYHLVPARPQLDRFGTGQRLGRSTGTEHRTVHIGQSWAGQPGGTVGGRAAGDAAHARLRRHASG